MFPTRKTHSFTKNLANSTSMGAAQPSASEVISVGGEETQREALVEVCESDKDGEKEMNARKFLENKNIEVNLPISFANVDMDDIETQIKTSVMLRRPINNSSCAEVHVYSQNHAGGCDKFEAVTITTAAADDSELGIDDAQTNLHVSEEEISTTSKLSPHELNDFPRNELIVFDENDLNNSRNSDVLAVDPLAIDEFIVPDSSHIQDSLAPLKSENDTSTDELWINVDEIKTCDITHNLPKNACEEFTPPITPTIAEKHDDRIEVVKCDTFKKSKKGQNDDEHPEELRGEGSDSGLGSETSVLQTTINSPNGTLPSGGSSEITNSPPGAVDSSSGTRVFRSNLKRRFVETGLNTLDSAREASVLSSERLSDSVQKKAKRSISFKNVYVYSFPRQQGFGCVPSVGGCTLGMSARHAAFKTLTLAEHAAELRRAHRQRLQDLPSRGSAVSSSEDSEESEEDYLSEDCGSDADVESSGYLQPVPPKIRRVLLKSAGVRKIEACEKVECNDIRDSRDVCGCSCRGFCDPETCSCSQDGIKCQVDRAMFPCGCSRDACGNPVGRIEFNPARVRTHFIHTLMRLDMESRQQQKPNLMTSLAYDESGGAAACSTPSLNEMAGNYYNMQPPQSGFNSGYASPVYQAHEQLAYYQQQQAPEDYGNGALQNNHVPQQPYQVDSCLDPSLLLGGMNTAYGELMPAFGSDGHSPLTYANVSNSITDATVSSLPYSAYNQIGSSPTYLPMNAAPMHTNRTISPFSSCAVPSAPPYGPAMTTATSSAQYHSSSSVSGCQLESHIVTSPSRASISNCSTLENAANFISLNSPISNSSRMSVINQLLQHNRNTTAALVAVAHTSSRVVDGTLCNLNSDSSITNNRTTASMPPTLAIDEMATSPNSTSFINILGESERICNTTDIVGGDVLAKPLQTESQADVTTVDEKAAATK